MVNIGLFNAEGKELSINEVIAMLPLLTNLENVNRVEVIDQNGRSYVNWKPTNKTMISFQDDNRTLKVFIKN
ncbi:MAG: hypothetical protein IPO64_07555 [Bacteroidetes bacterium]|nr:hypothetical protein [Bacteroidota bacterium]